MEGCVSELKINSIESALLTGSCFCYFLCEGQVPRGPCLLLPVTAHSRDSGWAVSVGLMSICKVSTKCPDLVPTPLSLHPLPPPHATQCSSRGEIPCPLLSHHHGVFSAGISRNINLSIVVCPCRTQKVIAMGGCVVSLLLGTCQVACKLQTWLCGEHGGAEG